MPYGYVAVLYQRVGKLYAGRLADLHGSGGAGEQSGFGIALVHLYPVVVAACHKQVFAVRRYGKVTRVFASVLVSDFLVPSGLILNIAMPSFFSLTLAYRNLPSGLT